MVSRFHFADFECSNLYSEFENAPAIDVPFSIANLLVVDPVDIDNHGPPSPLKRTLVWGPHPVHECAFTLHKYDI